MAGRYPGSPKHAALQRRPALGGAARPGYGSHLRYGAALNVLRVARQQPVQHGRGRLRYAPGIVHDRWHGCRWAWRRGAGLHPQHLVNWTKIAFDKQSDFDAQSFASLSTHDVEHATGTGGDTLTPEEPAVAELREEIRRIIIEELRDAITGLKI